MVVLNKSDSIDSHIDSTVKIPFGNLHLPSGTAWCSNPCKGIALAMRGTQAVCNKKSSDMAGYSLFGAITKTTAETKKKLRKSRSKPLEVTLRDIKPNFQLIPCIKYGDGVCCFQRTVDGGLRMYPIPIIIT